MSAPMLRKRCERMSLLLCGAAVYARGAIVQLSRELAHLDTARIGREELARLPRKQRVRAVKQALAAHHRHTTRCC
jgi:hypothetical protein